MKNPCREYTILRSEQASRVRGWILGNTKIGSVLDVKVCHHKKRYGIEIMIESLFRDGTASWVRIENGINLYVTETSETTSIGNVERRVTGNLVRRQSHDQRLLWYSRVDVAAAGFTVTSFRCALVV